MSEKPTRVNQHIEFVSRDGTGIVTVVTSAGVIDAQTVIDDIRAGRASFFAGPTAWDRSPVTAHDAFGGAYLFANWDGTRRNNLHQLAPRTEVRPVQRTHSGPVRTRFGPLRALVRTATTFTLWRILQPRRSRRAD
jgi:hypothetical protein